MISSVNWSVLGITAHYSPPGREGEREGGGNLEASERSQLAVAVWPLTRAFSSAVRPSAARMCKRKASFGPVSSSSIHRRHSSCPFHAALCKDVCPASLVKVKSMPLSKIHLHVTTYARREASQVSEVTPRQLVRIQARDNASRCTLACASRALRTPPQATGIGGGGAETLPPAAAQKAAPQPKWLSA